MPRTRRDGVALGLLLISLILPAAAWGHAAGFFMHHSEFGEPIESAYLTGSHEFRSEPWWPDVIAFYQDGFAMQVETSLANDDFRTCNEIYERIWMQPGFLATWNTGKLHIFDRDNHPMCGGAA